MRFLALSALEKAMDFVNLPTLPSKLSASPALPTVAPISSAPKNKLPTVTIDCPSTQVFPLRIWFHQFSILAPHKQSIQYYSILPTN